MSGHEVHDPDARWHAQLAGTEPYGPAPVDPDAYSAVVEHAVRYTGGAMLVRNPSPDIEAIFPLDLWVTSEKRFGGKVYRRTIVVIDDWKEV